MLSPGTSLRFLFSFSGRAGRLPYALLALPSSVMLLVLAVPLERFLLRVLESGSRPKGFTILMLWFIGLLGYYCWVHLALAAKRFHDMDRSAWGVLLLLVPVVNVLALLYLAVRGPSIGPNDHGEVAEELELVDSAVIALLFYVPLILALFLMFSVK